MVAAVAFVIGIGIGLKWGPFASRGGKAIETPVAHHADAERPAVASSEMVTPAPPDAPDTPSDPPEEIDAGPGTTPPEQQPHPTHPVEPSL